MRRDRRTLDEALDRFIKAEVGDQAARAWDELRPHISTIEDVQVVADMARATHRALVEEIERRKELVKTLEAGPNALLPVLLGVGENAFVISHGRGQCTLAHAMLDETTGQPVLTREEIAGRGYAIAALDPGGGTILRVFWPEEDEELAHFVLGLNTGVVDSVQGGDQPDQAAVSVPVEVEVSEG